MSEWSDSQLQLAGPRVFLVLLPFLLAFVYWVYQRTYPQVEPKRRLVLVALRAVAVALLAMVLCEPVLTWWHQQVIRPLVLVLVDTSTSMKVAEGPGTRLQQAVAVLGDEGWSATLQQAEVRAWGFAESAYPLALDTVASASTRGQATDIGRALAASLEAVAEREHVQGVVLFSDGGHNLGRDPVQLSAELGVPVYALGVGGAEVPVDVQLVDVRTAETGYVGQSQPVDAKVRSWGYEGQRVEVQLYEGERLLQRQSLLLEGDGQVQQISFAVTPQQVGPRIFRVVVAPAAGEFATADNEALAFTRILAGRPQALLLAGGPSEDLTFLRRSLSADSSWVVEVLIQREPDAFYGGAWNPAILQGRDVVLLVNPGTWLLNGPPATALVQHVYGGAGLLLVGGAKMARAWRPDSPLAALMPLQVAGPVPFVPGEVLLRLSAAGRRHPVVRQPRGRGRSVVSVAAAAGLFSHGAAAAGNHRASRKRRRRAGPSGGHAWQGQGHRGPVRVFLAARPDEQRRRWPAADHSDVLARCRPVARARRSGRAGARLDRAARVPSGRGGGFCRAGL